MCPSICLNVSELVRYVSLMPRRELNLEIWGAVQKQLECSRDPVHTPRSHVASTPPAAGLQPALWGLEPRSAAQPHCGLSGAWHSEDPHSGRGGGIHRSWLPHHGLCRPPQGHQASWLTKVALHHGPKLMPLLFQPHHNPSISLMPRRPPWLSSQGIVG